MADTIHLDRDFSTNGVVIPAGKVSTDDLQSAFNIDTAAAKAMQDDLLRRQGKYAEYSKGIHERHEYSQNGGSIQGSDNS